MPSYAVAGMAGGPGLKRNFIPSRVPPVPRFRGPGRSRTRAALRAAHAVEGPAVAFAFASRTIRVGPGPAFLLPVRCSLIPVCLYQGAGLMAIAFFGRRGSGDV